MTPVTRGGDGSPRRAGTWAGAGHGLPALPATAAAEAPGSGAAEGRRANNAASLSRAAWRAITSWQFLGYGPALSVAVPAGPAGPGRAARRRPVLAGSAGPR